MYFSKKPINQCIKNAFLFLTASAALLSSSHADSTLVYCPEANPEGFAPMLYSTGTTFDASANPIFNRLVQFERGTAKLAPALAESWELSEDGLVHTLHLRKDVSFHSNKFFTPTRKMNADDAIFTFQRMFDEKHPWHKVSGGNYLYYHSQGIPQNIASITKSDDHTLVFTLKSPDATFLVNLAHPVGSILSAEYADKMMAAGTPEILDKNPIGTGPFEFVAFKPDAMVRYKAFKDYFRGKVPLDTLVFSITIDPSVRVAKLERGECDVIPYPNMSDIERLSNLPDVKIQKAEAMNLGYIAFNTEKPPFDNVKVRQALSLAVNKQSIVDNLYKGFGVVEKNPFPATIWGYNNDITPYAYDPEQAKKMLDEAGIKDLTVELWAMPVSRPYNPDAKKMAEMIQADLAKVGVKAKVVNYEWAEYIQRTRNGEHEMMMFGWTTANGDPDNFVYPLLSCEAAQTGRNLAFWCDETFNSLISDARKISDQEKRAELYKKAQVIFHDQAPWIPMARSFIISGVRDRVIDYKDSPFSFHDFEGVSVKAK